MATIRARVSRTVQLERYSPLTVELEASRDTKTTNPELIAQELDELEGALEEQVDAIIACRLNNE